MSMYLVELIKGVAGVDESANEQYEVEASSAEEAIIECASCDDCEGWDFDIKDNDYASLSNTEASNGSGRYNEYWVAENMDCWEI